MARTQTMVQLNDELLGELDAEAAERGISRSAVIREAVVHHLAERRERSIGRQIAEGYRRIPPATPDEWGRLDDIADAALRDGLDQLEADEKAAGLEW